MRPLYVLRPGGKTPDFMLEQEAHVVQALPGETIQESLDREFGRTETFVERVKRSGPLEEGLRVVITQTREVAIRIALDLEVLRFRRIEPPDTAIACLRGTSTHGRPLIVSIGGHEIRTRRAGKHVCAWDDRDPEAYGCEQVAVWSAGRVPGKVEVAHSTRTSAYAAVSEFDEWVAGTAWRVGVARGRGL